MRENIDHLDQDGTTHFGSFETPGNGSSTDAAGGRARAEAAAAAASSGEKSKNSARSLDSEILSMTSTESRFP